MILVLVFLGFAALIVLVFWVVSRITGARAHFLDAWRFEEGERVVWRDDRADFMPFLKLGQPANSRPLRLHRWPVVVTDRRILVANKTVAGRGMLRYVLYPGPLPDEAPRTIGGGLLTRGYSTLRVRPEAERRPEEGLVAFRPVEEETSSFNLRELRLYTEDVVGFRMPGEGGAADDARDPEPLSP